MQEKASRDPDAPAERGLLEHLGICTECAKLADQLERTWIAMEHHPTVEVSQDFVPKLKARIRTERAAAGAGRKRRPALRWQWAAVAVCVMLAAVVLMRTWHPWNADAGVDETDKLAAERNHRDELFLQNLEQTLRTSAPDYLSTYDSWPGGIPEQLGIEPSGSRPARKAMKKESS